MTVYVAESVFEVSRALESKAPSYDEVIWHPTNAPRPVEWSEASGWDIKKVSLALRNADWDEFFKNQKPGVALRPPQNRDPWLQSPQLIAANHVSEIWDKRSEIHPRWSIVVPAHQHAGALASTLRHIEQAMTRAPFSVECILVWDANPNETEWPLPIPEFESVGIRAGRSEIRDLGASGYRSGSIRNLGSGLARGENLLFLDADILVPENLFVNWTLSEPGQDWWQAKRWHVVGQELEYGRISKEWDAVLSEKGVWEEFQKLDTDWNWDGQPWAWASTFFMAINRARFERLGGFRESFDSYGFEDTELGYRHFKASGQFRLVDVDVFHQMTRTEYKSVADKKRLLKQSAEWFRRWTLDAEVHDWLKTRGL